MRHIAIIGSGPAGYYTAEALQKVFGADGVSIDIIDRLPVPYGLIRFGVAPDHQSIKAVTRRYEKTALGDNVRFAGNVSVGSHVSVDELKSLYDAVIFATGAPRDRKLAIEGNDLPGVIGSAEFVGWYNGHPDFATLDPDLSTEHVVVVGNGNVALDVARILAKQDSELVGSDIVAHARKALGGSKVRKISLLGRRGPHQISMTPKELGELGRLERAKPLVDPADLPPEEEDEALDPGSRKSVTLLREFAATDYGDKPVTVDFDFFASPVRIEGDGKVERVIVERTELRDGRSVGTGETYAVPAGLVVSCIGYSTPELPGVPYDESAGRFASDEGRMGDGLYAAGWARRGPTGTIGTNKPDGYMIADHILADLGDKESGKRGRAGLDELLDRRGVKLVRFRDWKRLEDEEVRRAIEGAPREKFVIVDEMLEAIFGNGNQHAVTETGRED